jgi:putative NADPH-quinone reductase
MKIVVIVGHPDPSEERLNRALADCYAQAATQAGNDVRRIDVARLEFPVLRTYEEFYRGSAPPAVASAQADIAWADHIAFFFPLWLADMPAFFKAFIEQTFRPGFAIDVQRRAKLLAGKSARLVVTMGMPALVYRTYFGAHMIKSVKHDLTLCGIAPVFETLVGNVEGARPSCKRRWFRNMARVARRDARKRRGVASTVARVTVAAAAAAVGGYLLYVARAWSRYGTVERGYSLLDRVMPECDVRLRHHLRIHAPAPLVFETISHADFERSPIVQALFRARHILLGGRGPARELPRGLLAELDALGWNIIGEEPDTELVFGAITQPWQSDPTFRGLTADEFRRFDEPGYVKVAFTLRVDALSPDACVAHTETRAAATDAASRTRFRRYWAFLSPGIDLIRIVLLAQLKAESEARRKQLERAV